MPTNETRLKCDLISNSIKLTVSNRIFLLRHFSIYISSAQLSIKVVCIANDVFVCVCVFCVVNLDCAYRFGFVVHLVFHRDTHSTSTKVLESWALLVEFYRWSFLMPLLRENANLHIALLLFDRGSKYKVLIKNRFETKLQIWFVLQWLWLIRIISFSCDFVQILVVGT